MLSLNRKASGWPRLFVSLIMLMMSSVQAVPPSSAFSEKGVDKFLALGTASREGVYHLVGSNICDNLNKERLQHGIRCMAYNTGGSMYNLQALASRSLDLDVALSREDLALNFMSSGRLRAVAFLYHEPIMVMVKKKAGINSLGDFSNKDLTINIGNPGSGKRVLSEMLFELLGWSDTNFKKVTELDTKQMSRAFCDGDVDILVQMMGVPASLYDKLTTECDAVAVEIDDVLAEKIIEKNPGFRKMQIPAGVIPNHDRELATVGGSVLLLTSENVHPYSIYILTQSLVDNLQSLRASHRALERLTPEMMFNEVTKLQLHPGAERFFNDAGLTSKVKP